jgi:hypothetical protein
MSLDDDQRLSYLAKVRQGGLLWEESSEAQNNNELATSALRLGTSGTACSRAWHELYGRSFGCGAPHVHGSSNCLVSAIQTEEE